MSSLDLVSMIEGIPSLRGVFLSVLPECLLFDALIPEDFDDPKAIEEVAMLFGEMVQVNQRVLSLLGASSSDFHMLVEASVLQLSVRALPYQFVGGFVFEADLPVGMVRLFSNRIAGEIGAQLHEFAARTRSRVGLLLEYARERIGQPSTLLRRVSLRTGFGLDALQNPDHLGAIEVKRVEAAICDILGVDQLEL